MTDQEHSKWQRDLAEMEILLLIIAFSVWVAFWSLIHYGVVVL